jgi:hypothetical protein
LGAANAGKGKLVIAAALGETTMARTLGRKGKEGRRGSGRVVEPRGGWGGAQDLFIGAENGELERCR